MNVRIPRCELGVSSCPFGDVRSYLSDLEGVSTLKLSPFRLQCHLRATDLGLDVIGREGGYVRLDVESSVMIELGHLSRSVCFPYHSHRIFFFVFCLRLLVFPVLSCLLGSIECKQHIGKTDLFLTKPH